MYSSSNLPILISTITGVNALPQYQGRNVEGEAGVKGRLQLNGRKLDSHICTY
jgi:hypothetical protein